MLLITSLLCTLDVLVRGVGGGRGRRGVVIGEEYLPVT